MLYTPGVVLLAKADSTPKFDLSKFDAAAKWLYEQGHYSSEMLSDPRAMAIINETAHILTEAFDQGIAGAEIPPEMDYYLRNSLFEFSGFKTHQELCEVASLIRTEDGKVKPFNRFALDVHKTHADYNVNYLAAEYQFAVSSSQMAARWAEVERDGDDYDLQYRTAGDASVRESHRALHSITLAPSDPFWDKYYPPNGWGCRCTAVQVRKNKYEVSDSQEAIAAGLESTKQVSGGIDKGAIFRFNPGKTRQVLPPKHPYYKMSALDAAQVKKVTDNMIPRNAAIDLNEVIKGKSITEGDFKNIMTKYAAKFSENYNGGLTGIDVKRSSRAFMSNSRSTLTPGNLLTLYNHDFTIAMGVKFNPFRDAKEAFQSIRSGKALSFNQEYAMESLWHETLHAKALGWKDRRLRNDHTVMQMETINQFVARHTYPQFIESFAGKASNQKQIIEKGYGYGGYVDNFRELLKHHKIKESEMVDAISDKLFNEPYENVGASTVKFLESKGVKNAAKCMNSLKFSKQTFDELLN